MANYNVCLIVQYLILPVLLSTCCFLRPVGLSLPYLLFLFYLPFAPTASQLTGKGHIGHYSKLLLLVSIVLCLVQIIFQILLASLGQEFVKHCGFTEIILRHVGLVRLDNLDAVSITQWIAPEVISLLGSIAAFFVLNRKATTSAGTEAVEDGNENPLPRTVNKITAVRWKILTSVRKVTSLAVLCITGALQPSTLNFVYYIVFLGVASWWACNKKLERAYGIVLRMTLVFLILHITALFLYQNPWPQKLLLPVSTLSRFLGFVDIYSSSCDGEYTDIRVINFNKNLSLDYILNPVVLIVCYFVVAVTSKVLLRPKPVGSDPKKTDDPNPKMIEDTTEDAITKEKEGAGLLGQMTLAAGSICAFIYKNSYVFTNVLMMAWSIIYHSWFGLVLLIWANLIWIIPNHRQNMLRSSPFLVAYAEFLLLSTYLFGMDLPDYKLPTSFPQIGFVKNPHYPVAPILLKTVFTGMFWVSLRQVLRERALNKKTPALADINIPSLQTTEDTKAQKGVHKKSENASVFATKAAKIIKAFLVKYWIFIVALTLLLCGVTGNQVTGFKIVYMAMFLVFMLTFQFSYILWRKFMYGFLLVVIVCSSVILLLVYTYQFPETAQYFKTFLQISVQLQSDIGLERFDAKQLFLNLFIPTVVVIITVIQLHYCHKKFLEASSIPEDPEEGTVEEDPDDDNKDHEDGVDEIETKKKRGIAKKLFKRLLHFAEIAMLFIEIHAYKILLVLLFSLAATGADLLHLTIVGLGVTGLKVKIKMKFLVTRVASLIASILLISMMIYQFKYIDSTKFEGKCDKIDQMSQVTNNAEWLGFRKIDNDTSLIALTRTYLVYIVLVSLHSFIILRQRVQRIKKNLPPETPDVVFENIRRCDADEDIPHCFKYLVNYGFYKFGLEICLICFVMVIGYRMDLIACFYSMWLAVLFNLKREKTRKVWRYATYSIMASIPIQYISLIGLPPGLCTDYPWHRIQFLRDFSSFAFLPENTIAFKSKSKLLLLDFTLLLLMCLQTIVFKIEAKHENSVVSYSGGSNKSILDVMHLVEAASFVNQTHDFMDKPRNYLDTLKRLVFSFSFWAALAIVFLAGTSHGNIFSIGYIVGSFVFFWQGKDFYLRPINIILKWWDYLIAYNVSVIAMKSLIQLVGCLVLNFEGIGSVCWLIQLFGVNCLCATAKLDPAATKGCDVPLKDSGLFWDAFCFAFLIIQRRQFSSQYFWHVINDTKASLILASRGNELVEEMRVQEINIEAERERLNLQKIREKIDHIKATHSQTPEMNDHATAVRSGGYDMFEDIEDDFDLDTTSLSDSDGEEEKNSSSHQRLAGKMSFPQLWKKIKGKHERERLQQLQQNQNSPSETLATDERVEDPNSSEGGVPSTSRSIHKDDDVMGDNDTEAAEKSTTLMDKLKMVPIFISSIIVSITLKLHRLSRNYQYVSQVLASEKKTLKQSPDFAAKLFSASYITAPPDATRDSQRSTSPVDTASTQDIRSRSHSFGSVKSNCSVQVDSNSRGKEILEDQSNSNLAEPASSSAVGGEPQDFVLKIEDKQEVAEADCTDKGQNILLEFFHALWYVVLSHTDLICYSMVFLNQITAASILSLPLPLMVLLWGSLTFPRPPKAFWIALIAYTQASVLIKCFFQFDSWFWNNDILPTNQPLTLTRILGIEKNSGYATYDLVLLLALYFHRNILKSQGLWQSETPKDNAVPINTGAGTKFEAINKEMVDDNEEKVKISPEENENSVDDKGVVCEDQPDKKSLNNAVKVKESIMRFFRQLFNRDLRINADVYVWLFLCDFVNFFVILFGFSAFGKYEGDGGVISYLAENKVPITFLLMLIIQFCLIISDRALYLRKNLVGKIAFHILLTVVLHAWIFFVLPSTTGRKFNARWPPVMYYTIKCIYLLLSAYQIRCGYPARIHGHFLTKSFNLMNSTGFQVFMKIPFLMELRRLMDWLWTDSSMTLDDWLKMEDIFHNVYLAKCSRELENDLPAPRGQKKGSAGKYPKGGGMILLIIAVIWFPIALFVFSNSIAEPNIPFEVSMSLEIFPYEPLYFMSAYKRNITNFTKTHWDKFLGAYSNNMPAVAFLNSYEPEDIAVVTLDSFSWDEWDISQSAKERLLGELKNNTLMTSCFSYSVQRRKLTDEDSGTIEERRYLSFHGSDEIGLQLIKVLEDSSQSASVIMPHLFPKFLKVKNFGRLIPAHQLTDGAKRDGDILNYSNLSLSLYEWKVPNDAQPILWWNIRECIENPSNELPFNDCDNHITMYLFCDRLFPSAISSLAVGGIIGLYIVVVYAFSNCLRETTFTGASTEIIFDDMPSVDRVLQLCLDIYLVREFHEFALEEDLFAKLIFLYRSPETIIKWTRPKRKTRVDDDVENI